MGGRGTLRCCRNHRKGLTTFQGFAGGGGRRVINVLVKRFDKIIITGWEEVQLGAVGEGTLTGG